MRGPDGVVYPMKGVFHEIVEPERLVFTSTAFEDAQGNPIDDAEVTVQFFMPAMPTMNMPAMKSDAKLAPAGGGVYRGSGQVMMAGRWDATVTVVRRGQRLGTKQQPVVAR